MPTILALGKSGEENHNSEFKSSLDHIVKFCLKNKGDREVAKEVIRQEKLIFKSKFKMFSAIIRKAVRKSRDMSSMLWKSRCLDISNCFPRK